MHESQVNKELGGQLISSFLAMKLDVENLSIPALMKSNAHTVSFALSFFFNLEPMHRLSSIMHQNRENKRNLFPS